MLRISIDVIVGVSLAFTLFRLFHGPDVLDRLLGYSSVTAKIVILLAVEGIFGERTVFVNLALIYAILSFLGIVIIARYIEREV
ncbi:pH regulation protein F [Candidatus Bipolaricaulota bacterium]|nr:pH regulation protein F [Candidatus Bipolaricaulota bacterium]